MNKIKINKKVTVLSPRTPSHPRPLPHWPEGKTKDKDWTITPFPIHPSFRRIHTVSVVHLCPGRWGLYTANIPDNSLIFRSPPLATAPAYLKNFL